VTPSGQAAIDKVAALAGWATNAELVADVTPLIEQAESEARAAALREVAEIAKDYITALDRLNDPEDLDGTVDTFNETSDRLEAWFLAILTEATGASE
jgi:hypothetical protein